MLHMPAAARGGPYSTGDFSTCPSSSSTTRRRHWRGKKVSRCRPASSPSPRSQTLVISPERIFSGNLGGQEAERVRGSAARPHQTRHRCGLSVPRLSFPKENRPANRPGGASIPREDGSGSRRSRQDRVSNGLGAIGSPHRGYRMNPAPHHLPLKIARNSVTPVDEQTGDSARYGFTSRAMVARVALP